MWQPVGNGVEWVKFPREYLQVMVAVLMIIRNSKLGTEDCVSCLGTWVAVVAVIKTWEHLLDLLCRVGWGFPWGCKWCGPEVVSGSGMCYQM